VLPLIANIDKLSRVQINAYCTQLIRMNFADTDQKPTKFISDAAWSSLLLMHSSV